MPKKTVQGREDVRLLLRTPRGTELSHRQRRTDGIPMLSAIFESPWYRELERQGVLELEREDREGRPCFKKERYGIFQDCYVLVVHAYDRLAEVIEFVFAQRFLIVNDDDPAVISANFAS